MVNEVPHPGDAFLSLRAARERRVPWIDIAEIIAKTVGPESGVSSDQRALWLNQAAVASGYTPGALRRFVNVLTFLRRIPERKRPDRQIIENSFTAIEMIQRISRHDPVEADRLLGEIGTRRLTISRLRLALKGSTAELSGHASRARRRTLTPEGRLVPSVAGERNWRIDAALGELYRLLPELTGKFEHFGRPLGVAPMGIRCDAVAWIDTEWSRGDGFEIVFAPSSAAKSFVSDRVTRAVVAARFFRRFFIAFTPESSEAHVGRVVQALNLLDAKSVGVVRLGVAAPLIRKRTGKSDPDWSDRLSGICPGGHWDEDFFASQTRK